MGTLLLWTIVLGGPVCAALALVAASRAGQFNWVNIAVLAIPPALFVATSLAVGTQEAGIGLMLWPVVVLLIASYGLALKVFVVDRALRAPFLLTSRACLAAASSASVLFALVAPQWWE